MQLLSGDDIILQGLIKGQPIKNTPIHHLLPLYAFICFSSIVSVSLNPSFLPCITVSYSTPLLFSPVGNVPADIKTFYCDCCNECNHKCDSNQ